MKNTKLTVACLALVLVVARGPLSAQKAPPPEFTSLSFADRGGAYAIYRDTRFDETVYIGLCALGGNQLALRLYEPESKNELLVVHTFYTVPDASSSGSVELEPGTISLIRGSFTASAASQRLLPTVYAWLNAWLHSRSGFAGTAEYDFEDESWYRFSWWVPIMQLSGVLPSAGDGPGEVSLLTAGVATSVDDPAFFAFAGIPAPASGVAVKIGTGETRPVILDGLSFNLDPSWKKGGDGAYRIVRDSIQEALLRAERLDLDDFGQMDSLDLLKLILLDSGPILLGNTVRLFKAAGNPAISYRLQDPSTGQVTIQFKVCVKQEANTISLVSLGVLESVYAENKDLFDAILF